MKGVNMYGLEFTTMVIGNKNVNLQDETDSIAETDTDRDMKRDDGEREGGAINLTSR